MRVRGRRSGRWLRWGWPGGRSARLVWVAVALPVLAGVFALLSVLISMVLGWLDGSMARAAVVPVDGPPLLREDRWAVAYSPGKGQPGVPMQLDLLDARSTLHVPLLARSGWVGLQGQPDVPLGRAHLHTDGFPVLELAWPSVHLPDPGWCTDTSASRSPEDVCPVLGMRLRSTPLTDADRAWLAASTTLPDQESLPSGQRTVTLWTAFTTRTAQDGTPRWAGWVCDVPYLVSRNEDLNTWGLDESLLAMDLADADCHAPPTRLTRYWPELAYRWPVLGRHEVHPVVWVCPPGSGCEARFAHANRMVSLALPGGFIDGEAEDESASAQPAHLAHLHLRPRLVQAAWQTLEDAARHVGTTGNTTALQWLRTMQQETAWCEALAERMARQPPEPPGQAQAAQGRRREGRNEVMRTVTSAHPRGPCARAFHRVLHHLELPPDGNAPPVAPQAVAPEVLASAQRLAQAEERISQRLSDPLWHAVDALLLHSPPATRTLARLRWHSTSVRLQQAPLEVLALYDAAGADTDRLSPAEHIRLRMQLAWALEHRILHQTPAQALANPALGDRVAELFWQASQQWLGTSADDLSATLDPVDGVALLVHTASHLRAAITGASGGAAAGVVPAGGTLPVAAQPLQQRLATVVQGMELLARQLAARNGIGPNVQAVQLGTLAVHAAWHAHHLALTSSTGVATATSSTTAARTAWRDWLNGWADWQLTQLPLLPQGASLLAGVELHRDAARSGKRTSPDCPGGHLLGCRMALP